MLSIVQVGSKLAEAGDGLTDDHKMPEHRFWTRPNAFKDNDLGELMDCIDQAQTRLVFQSRNIMMIPLAETNQSAH